MHITTDLAPKSNPPAKLGEELPIFCEQCGYSLHGLPQVRCGACDILQFHCPECGHHQPINTLRPAAQRILGRLRAIGLVWVMLFKLNYFGWLLFAWVAMGVEWSYFYSSYQFSRLDQLGFEAMLGFGVFALLFGMVSRMLLLRWRASWIVGTVLALLVSAAIGLGIWLRTPDARNAVARPREYELYFNPYMWWLMVLTFGLIVLGSVIVWPIWVGLVRAFIPKTTGEQLLNWQRSQSDRPVSGLGRE